MIEGLNLSDNFADRLVQIIKNRRKDPLQTAKTTVILPTKRSVLGVKNAFVKISGETPILVPKLVALYDMDDLTEDLPPALSPLERLFMLARLCREKPNVTSFDKALKIAQSLAELMDEFYEYSINPQDLNTLIEEKDLALHWQESLTFLDILTEYWPRILKEKNKMDIVERRIFLIDRLKNKILHSSPDEFYILAGLDGETPVVRNLIKETANQENVLVLLNGLNVYINDDEVKVLTESHYQYSLNCLLRDLGKKAADIPLLSQTEQPQEAVIREAFKPAELTNEWAQSNLTPAHIQNVKRYACENMAEEALTIALILRETLETPEKTAALVTSDRNLARRVISEMRRWGIKLDDSAGTPLNNTPVGIFLLLTAEYGVEQTEKSLLSVLKHPLCADGRKPSDLRETVRQTEKKARLKGQKFQPKLNIPADKFLKLFKSSDPVVFSELLMQHLSFVELLAASSDKTGKERLWQTDDGEKAYQFLTELKEQAQKIDPVPPELYPQILNFLMRYISVRPKYGTHPRLDILGPIGARLSHPDVCIIGGLNEGTFPSLPDTGPWLSRLMRQKIHLPSPERIFASQSMDFAFCFCAKEVHLTRSLKAGGSQTIPSRFISRIEAVLSAPQNERGKPNILWEPVKHDIVQQLDQPLSFEKIVRPSPCPPKEFRPRTLSVTRIKDLMTNPYAVYARYILNLKPLKELESFDIRKDYGTAVHNAFKEMAAKENLSVSDTAAEIEKQLRSVGCGETDLAYYKTKIEKTAEFYVTEENKRREKIEKPNPEITGKISFPLCDGTVFTLTAIADRIDQMRDGSYDIIDYKTGSIPDKTAVKQGVESQLPLEGLILLENGFKECLNAKDIHFSYWRITGKGTGGEIKNWQEDISVSQLIAEAKEGVTKLLNAYQNDTQPYESHLMPKFIKYDDYEHLARVKEWLTEEGEVEE